MPEVFFKLVPDALYIDEPEFTEKNSYLNFLSFRLSSSTASSDHQSNNSSDEYQQTFYVAETALMQAEKSLVDKMIGPINTGTGNRDRDSRFIPRNADSSEPAPTKTLVLVT